MSLGTLSLHGMDRLSQTYRPNGFIRSVDPALDHQFLNIAETEVEPEVHPDGAANNVWMEPMTDIN